MTGKPFDILVLSSSPPPSSFAENNDTYIARPATPSSSRNGQHQHPQHQSRRAISSYALSPPPAVQHDRQRQNTATARGALVSGSRATAIPDTARRGFMSARSLVEELGGLDGEVNNGGPAVVEETQKKKVVKERKKRVKKDESAAVKDDGLADDVVEVPQPKPRARKKKDDAVPKRTRKTEPAYVASAHFGGVDVVGDIQADGGEHEEIAVMAPPEVKPKEPKVAKPRKPRAKKADKVEGETAVAPKKTRVTKPKAERKKRKSAEVVSAHFQREVQDKIEEHVKEASPTTKAPMPALEHKEEEGSIWNVPATPTDKNDRSPKHRPPDPIHEPLELDEAVSRRLQWTPPKDTSPQSAQPGSSSKENTPANTEAARGGFTSLLSGYAYASAQPVAAASTTSSTTARTLTKRRRVELIDVPGNQATSRQSSPEKGKAPKKKARTITDLVTEQYAPKAPELEPASVTSNFFSTHTTVTTTKLPLNDTTNAPAVKPARKKRAPAKPKPDTGDAKKHRAKASAKAAKAAKPKLLMDKLLSPSSAVLKMNRQEILFGTSSQLALDESPTIVRQIQQAMAESEQDAELFQVFGHDDPARTNLWPRLKRIEGKRGLWNASARDQAGELMEMENDVYMPEPDRTQDPPLLLGEKLDDASSPFVDIDDLPPSATKAKAPIIQLSSDLPTPPDTLPEEPIAADAGGARHDSSFAHIDDFLQEPPPSNQNAESSFAHIDDFSPPASYIIHPPPKPPPKSASAGSPTKRGDRPSKSVSAVPSPAARKVPSPTKQPPIAAPTTPSRPKRFIHVEEILDSEDDEALSPTPPRTRRMASSPPLSLISLSPTKPIPTSATTTAPSPHALLNPTSLKTTKPAPKPRKPTAASTDTNNDDDQPTPVLLIPERNLSFPAIKHALFTHITSLVRCLPPTKNPSMPSWHEKILLYDPIVLEDFTAFLNAQEGVHTHKKATVKQVRDWNRWRKGRGEGVLPKLPTTDEGKGDDAEKEGENNGDGGGEGKMVYAVERPLETFIVQKWCEEMSVCCVAREKQKSGVRKGLY